MVSASNPNERLELPVLAIKKNILFPTTESQFTIGRERSVNAFEIVAASDSKQCVLLFQSDSELEEPTASDFNQIGVLGLAKKANRAMRDDKPTYSVYMNGLERIKVKSNKLVKRNKKQLFLCEYEIMQRVRFSNGKSFSDEALKLAGLIKTLSVDLVGLSVIGQDLADYTMSSIHTNDFDKICYWLCFRIFKRCENSPGHQSDDPLYTFLSENILSVLNAETDMELLTITHKILSFQAIAEKTEQDLNRDAQDALNKSNTDYYMRTKLQSLNRKLNIDDDKSEADLLKQKLEQIVPMKHLEKTLYRELKRLSSQSALSPDYQVVRTYLEIVSELPWNTFSTDNYDLKNARAILDADHYGLDKIKERIIEFLAVKDHAPTAKSPIICLVGPPGIGKTSLGQSVARALGRKFERIALGGVHDESELRGHRKTYIGSMPGKIITALKRCGTANPVILLDEIDKIAGGHANVIGRGDPSAALLEILDPAQNSTFRDNYLDLEFDLSNVMFICTANYIGNISSPLLDRMEVLDLSSYTETEKLHIAKEHLIPKEIEEVRLPEGVMQLSDDMIRYIIYNYTREAGVRKLKQKISQLARKAIVNIKENRPEKNVFTENTMKEFLGIERPFDGNKRSELNAGVSTGLAWSELGGSVLYIESTKLLNSKDLIVTGLLGDSMKESTRIGLSYLWANANKFGINTTDLKDIGIHMHFPEGATPKDGPSAGIAIITALTSLFTNKPMRIDTAMTGEFTLSGNVLPIGGLKEKALAAMKSGIKRVIIPKENEKDLYDFPQELLDGIEFIPVATVDEVLLNAFEEFRYPYLLNVPESNFSSSLNSNQIQ